MLGKLRKKGGHKSEANQGLYGEFQASLSIIIPCDSAKCFQKALLGSLRFLFLASK